MKVFVTRHPLGFSLLLTGALLGLAFASRVALPTHTVSSVADLPSDLGPLSDRELALFTMRSSETLFYLLTSLLVIVLVTWLGWWSEAGFNWPSRWRNPHLLLFPLLVSALTLLGGIRVPGPAFFISILLVLLLAAFSEEALYRGIAWRALLPKKGVIQAVITTSLLFGVLRFGRFVFGGPWPEAFYLTILTTCVGVTYAALRWRTASIWPAILFYLVLGFVGYISTPEKTPYLVPLLVGANTFFVGYGLLVLRNPRVREDGG